MLYMFQKFAGEGLRTLCLAVRDLDEMFFNDWKHRHHEAALSLDNRDEKLDAIYEEIERDMTLIGEWLLPKKEWRFFFVINHPDALISQIYFGLKLCVFRTVPLSIIRSPFTVHSAMLYVIQVCRQLSGRARPCLKAAYKPV
jgi:hypothetical protein